MSNEYFWNLPSAGDGRYGNALSRRRGERLPNENPPIQSGVSDPRDDRFNYFDYLHQVARAAELSGFHGVHVDHDERGDESWIIAGYLARGTRRLKIIAEFSATWGSPVYAAKNAATFQRYTAGRFGWHLRPDEAEGRIAEFVQVAKGVLTTAPYSFKGRYFEVREGGFHGGLDHQPLPPVFLSGSDRAALEQSAKFADVHLHPVGSIQELKDRVTVLDQLAKEQGRVVRHAARLDLVARETEAEAQTVEATFLRQRLEASDPAVGTARVVGDYAQVARRLEAYQAVGVSTFILGAVPSLEEAYLVGAHVLPLLRGERSSAPSVSQPQTGASL